MIKEQLTDTWKTISTTGSGNLPYSGFTLIELIVVLGIMTLTLALFAHLTVNFLAATRLKESAKDIATMFRLARRLAITERGECRVVFDSEGRCYWIEDEKGDILEKKHSLQRNVVFANPHLGKDGEKDGIVEFNSPDDSALSFYPQGTAETGSVYLYDEDMRKWYTLTLTSSTGNVKLYPEKH